jgi:hypothetical protein
LFLCHLWGTATTNQLVLAYAAHAAHAQPPSGAISLPPMPCTQLPLTPSSQPLPAHAAPPLPPINLRHQQHSHSFSMASSLLSDRWSMSLPMCQPVKLRGALLCLLDMAVVEERSCRENFTAGTKFCGSNQNSHAGKLRPSRVQA